MQVWKKVVQDAIAEYKKLGATVVDISLPNTQLSIPVYYVLAPAEASSNLSRYDGVRYGHRAAEYGDFMDMYMKSRAEGFGAEVKRRILIGTYVLSAGYYDAYYLKAHSAGHNAARHPATNIGFELVAPKRNFCDGRPINPALCKPGYKGAVRSG